ncbi:polyphosphate kinase 1 [Limnohabitans sp. 2KL-1]|jgi:polyphosphate kinase|uniref:polyphosphate kinase 1 n=1 Tax=Limnohabitans sp. 2KL-1 TaxID=1100699 RepID=UPI000D33A388|nr:polyphosphate kinase 1 [Limnohabitans sp. 2KL-1]PUE47964.1 polyphosphate kinase 1 [Limnohabitans sp. 2KL-1]
MVHSKVVTSAAESGYALMDRDLSILAFNERVLDWAQRAEVPLLERLRYLCIVSSNLDEFFEVRAEPHVMGSLHGLKSGGYTDQTLRAIVEKTSAMVARQYALYNDDLLPNLERKGYRILSHGERNAEQRQWVRSYFQREVQPLLVPVGLDPAHPFPQVANKSLNFIVQLSGKDAFGRSNEIAIVKVPRVLPRLIPLPARVCGGSTAFVLLSSVIRAHLAELFPGREVGQFSQFRVTRHSDLAVDEDEIANLRMALRQGLQHRHYGQAVRLEVSANCSPRLAEFLRKEFQLPEAAVFRVNGPVNLVRLMQLIDLINAPELLFPPYTASFPAQVPRHGSVFARLKQGDVMIHQPFETFDGVLAFLRAAVMDPDVLAIKQTIYRAGSDPTMMDLLREAVRRGKEVTAVVELKARFDEEANINWAEQLESIGVQVVYGIVGLKTHAKMLLVTRREGRSLKRYGHLSTGNYNRRTAALYTDISYLTADADMTADMDQLFSHLASQSRLPKMKSLLVAPFQLHDDMQARIAAVGDAAARGAVGRIVIKMNALTDVPLIEALIEAGQKGAQIDLIVRGACMLPARVAGLSDNIRVRSVIGRFLEHSRVFYFCADQDESIYLSSADWMSRNMTRRIELAWPVRDPALRQRIIDECLIAYLHDGRDAWDLGADGQYHRVGLNAPGHGAQNALMQRYGVASQPD